MWATWPASRAGSGSLFAHQIIFSATNLMSLDGFCRHCEEKHELSIRHSLLPRHSPGSALMLPLPWDLTPAPPRHPHCGGRLGVPGPYLFHIISHHLLGSALSAHEGFQLPQTSHTASCPRPCTGGVPLPGTCLPQILTCSVPSHPSGLSSDVSLRHLPDSPI